MNNRIEKLFAEGYEIKDTGYGKKPEADENEKCYYVKSDTPGLKMWVLLEKLPESTTEILFSHLGQRCHARVVTELNGDERYVGRLYGYELYQIRTPLFDQFGFVAIKKEAMTF